MKSELYNNFLKYFDYESFINSLDKVSNRYSFRIKIDYYLRKIQTDIYDQKSYSKLRDLYSENENYFSETDKYNLLLTLSSFCVSNSIHDDKYLEEFFVHVKPLLNEKLFLANSSILHPALIRNIIVFSVQLSEFSYLEEFINTYSQYFPPELKSTLIEFCNAMMLFEKSKFLKSLEIISKKSFDVPVIKRDIKFLRTKLFYELGYFDLLQNEIDTSKHFISNSKTTGPEKKELANNFIKLHYKG